MATSLRTVNLPQGVQVDLYAATGIAVGTKITIQNTGNTRIRISESVAEPITSTGFNTVAPDKFVNSAIIPIGLWALSPGSLGGLLQVEVAS